MYMYVRIHWYMVYNMYMYIVHCVLVHNKTDHHAVIAQML